MALRPTALRTARWASIMLLPLSLAAQARAGDGFMFGAPRSSLTLRMGYAQPAEGSDIYTFVQKELTLGRGDLAGGSIAAAAAFFLSPRLALQMDLGYASRTAPSAYRKWVDNNNREIEQSTALKRIPLTAGLRYYLTPAGRSVGRLAWVPARVATYVAAGAGFTWYQFQQTGDFVDYQTLDVFPSTLVSRGWAPSAYAAVGVDYPLTARMGLTGEARYDLGRAAMGTDFQGFKPIDLSGTAISVGLTLRF
jgi:hypothetical protein